MSGIYFLGDKRFEVRETKPKALAKGDVLVKVAACGICGTDVHIYNGEEGSAAVTPPVVLGHEFSGIVEAVGSAVTSLKAGDHVSVDPNIYCGQCCFCRIGKKQLCENLQAIGVNRDGGFAEYCVCPETQCFKLNVQVPLEHGAMAEPLSCCLHGIDRAEIRQGDKVCVIGGGAIGLIMVQLARLAGASKVILSEPVGARRSIGLQVGADYAVNPVDGDFCAKIRELTGSDGVDVVIECVGSLVATKQAFEVARQGASILLFSVPKPDAVYDLSLMDVFKKELKICGSFINPDTFQRAVDMINSSRIQFTPIITHKYPVEKLEEAILMQMGSDSIKVLVVP